MGIDISLYRARIGCFLTSRKSKHQRKVTYTPYQSGSDIHYTAALIGLLFIVIFIFIWGLIAGHYHFVECFAVKSLNIYSSAPTTPYMHLSITLCDSHDTYGALYATFSSRVLLLSADVELNPGPTEDTKMILQALEKNTAELTSIKKEVLGVRSELVCLKSELNTVKSKVINIEQKQSEFQVNIDDIEKRLSDMEYHNDVLSSDISALSLQEDSHFDRFERIETRLNNFESEKLKCSLRVFGLDECEDLDYPLEHLVYRKFNEAKPNIISNPSHIASARRVGKGDVKNNRMVIVTFTLPEVKFDLFKYRTELRNCGIRISNDLSFSQRQQLKELNQRGWSGYFKNGTLIKRAKIVKRVYKSAVRPSDRLVTDVSTPMETIQEIDDSDDGVHGPP